MNLPAVSRSAHESDVAPGPASLNGADGHALRVGKKGERRSPWPHWLTRFPEFSPVRRAGPIILMYHQVTIPEDDYWSLAVSPQHFEEHLQVLARRRDPVSLRHLADEIGSANHHRRQVAITFDDGYADNLYHAKQILERFGIPATVFVVGEAVGREREFWWDELDRIILGRHALPPELRIKIAGRDLHWELRESQSAGPFSIRRRHSRERLHHALWRRLRVIAPAQRWQAIDVLRAWAGLPVAVRANRRVMTAPELHRLGHGGLIEIGSHTATHPRLAALPAAAQLEDIRCGKEQLEEIIGAPVTSFSYPFGGRLDVSAATVDAVRQAGFARACTTRKGTVQPSTDPLLLPRLYVADWSGEEFERQLAPWL